MEIHNLPRFFLLSLLERNKKIAAFYLKGETLAGAGAPFGLKKEMVRRILIQQGIHSRRRWSKAEQKPTAEEKLKLKQIKFWSQAALTADPSRCWIWKGKVSKSGYGRTCWYGKVIYVRQLAWQIYNNKAPKNYILDYCDNTKCINPLHLFESMVKKKET